MKKLFKGVRVDTIYLVAPVLKSQFLSLVLHKFDFIKDKNYQYIYTESDFAIKFNPIDIYGRPLQTKLMRSKWTLKLELQYKALRNMPDHVKELLRLFNWKIKQIELAFDFNTPYSQHFSYTGKAQVNYKFKKRNGEKVDCGQTYYIYSNSSPQQALIYNKKKQLRDKKEIEIDASYLLRYEITIKPKQEDQQPIHELQFDWIPKYLEKFIFIPNMKLIPKLESNTYKLMKKVMRRRSKHFKGIPDRQQDKIREIAKKNKFDFVSAFNDNIKQLFDWIPSRSEKESYSEEELFQLFG